MHTRWLEVSPDAPTATYAPHTKAAFRMQPLRLIYRTAAGLVTRVRYRQARRAGVSLPNNQHDERHQPTTRSRSPSTTTTEYAFARRVEPGAPDEAANRNQRRLLEAWLAQLAQRDDPPAAAAARARPDREGQ